MKKGATPNMSTFPSQSTILSTVSIHPDLWAETIRPTDTRDLRFNKIVHLRAVIAAGIYGVSSVDLAEKLIDHLRNNA